MTDPKHNGKNKHKPSKLADDMINANAHKDTSANQLRYGLRADYLDGAVFGVMLLLVFVIYCWSSFKRGLL